MFVPVNVGNPLGKNLGALAEEADLREFHALVFSPTSAAVHGSYDNLDQHYLKECINPFHCRHRIPYYWYKSLISLYAVLNSLSITDWLLEELVKEVDSDVPDLMPGRAFMNNIQDEDKLGEFSGREEIKEQCRFFEEKIWPYSK